MKLQPDTGPDIVYTHAVETADGWYLLVTPEQAVRYQAQVIDGLAERLAEEALYRELLAGEVQRLRARLAARPSLEPSAN